MALPTTKTSSAPGLSSVAYLEIDALQAGQRIDNFLQTRLKGVPKSHIYRMLRAGEVRVNKGRVKPAYRLQAGDSLRIPPTRQAAETAPRQPPAGFLARLGETIVYEDPALLIINKPSGMAVHGGSGISFGVIEGLRALYPDAPYLELVHRLDRDTSGCLMIAKKPGMLRHLHELLRGTGISKSYLALVKGHWPAQLEAVDVPLRKNLLYSGERVVRVDHTGKPALSHFTLKQKFDQSSLLEVALVTGRTHQIRVHAAYSGHPLAGDEKYGDADFNQAMRGFGLDRLFLHAARLRVASPELRLDIRAPLPAELKQVLRNLEHTHG